ncbi:MAG TPA: AzlC family ABC transporter permease [Burkholderiales bacterium]|jgi:predicted branched-subunit amino acid permease
MPNSRSDFLAGLRASVPLLIAIAPFGLVTGVAMAAAGIPPLEAMAMSVLVYAGASMLAAAQLIAAGAPALVVVLAAFIVNLRLFMYSASIRPYFAGESLARRLLVSYALVDNPYALFLQRFGAHPGAPGKFDYFAGLSVPVWICWQAAVGAGLLVGTQLPAAWKLDFAAPLAFIAMSVPLLRDRRMVAAAASAGITAVLAHGLPLRLGLALAAVAGIAVGFFSEKWPGMKPA